MKKITLLFLLLLVFLLTFTACGNRYSCIYCHKKVSEKNVCEPLSTKSCVCMGCATSLVGKEIAESYREEILQYGFDDYIADNWYSEVF